MGRFLTREYSYCVLTKDEDCCCGRTAHQVDAHDAGATSWAQMWKFVTRRCVYDASTKFGEIDTLWSKYGDIIYGNIRQIVGSNPRLATRS